MFTRLSLNSSTGKISIENDNPRKNQARSLKGKSLLQLISDYTVIDLETTGLDPHEDAIIEIGAIRYRSNMEQARFVTLVNPQFAIGDFITELTGITDEMLATAPLLEDVLPFFLEFVNSDIVCGHNVNFDINFLYDACMEQLQIPFSNDFIDTLRIARRLLPECGQYKLFCIAEYLQISPPSSHRSLADCETTHECYQAMIHSADNLDLIAERLCNWSRTSSRDIVRKTDQYLDEDNPLFNKTCVFTGSLQRMVRKDAMQVVVNIGGYCGDSVTQKTDFLILGNYDYCNTVEVGKSSKLIKAEKLILAGYDIQIISENVFYDMLPESIFDNR